MRKDRCVFTFIFVFVFYFGIITPCFAVEIEEAWRVLSQAWIAFENKSPGEALNLCEKARHLHREKNEYMRREISAALKPMQVKKVGDDIYEISSILTDRNEVTALAVLDSIFLTHSPSFFSNSMKSVLNWLETQSVYPEADYLTGRVYELEGEVALALIYYQKALDNFEIMDIPEERFTILYRMADLASFSSQSGLMENYLLRIVSEDSVYSQTKPLTPMLSAMLRTLQTEKTTDKFYLLYRHDYFKGLRAYQKLSVYYNQEGTEDRALSAAALSSLISITQLANYYSAYDFSWEYSSLADLFNRIGQNSELKEWARSAGVWDSFLLFGKILVDSDLKDQGQYLLSIISQSCPEKKSALMAIKLLEQTF